MAASWSGVAGNRRETRNGCGIGGIVLEDGHTGLWRGPIDRIIGGEQPIDTVGELFGHLVQIAGLKLSPMSEGMTSLRILRSALSRPPGSARALPSDA